MNNKQIYLSSPHMSGDEEAYIKEAFITNWIAPLGPHVDAFEREIAEYIGVREAVALSSGTAAIHLALKLIGISRGDVVFCSSLTFAASANPIIYEGATPVFIDSEPCSWNMSPNALIRAFDDAVKCARLPKAVIIVNLYGQSADFEVLTEICNKYNVPVIEDAAESLGAIYKGQKSGSIGKFGVFSFNGNKIITTSGGGMLVSNDSKALAKARFLATQARDKARHYQHSQLGYNYRLSNVLAAIGRGQLRVLDDRVSMRREIFNRYQRELSNIRGIDFMPEAPYNYSTRWLTVMTVDREVTGVTPTDILNALEEQLVEARPVWKPLHLQPIFSSYPYYSNEKGFSLSDRLFEVGVCLPSGSNLTEIEQEKVIYTIKKCLSRKK